MPAGYARIRGRRICIVVDRDASYQTCLVEKRTATSTLSNRCRRQYVIDVMHMEYQKRTTRRDGRLCNRRPRKNTVIAYGAELAPGSGVHKGRGCAVGGDRGGPRSELSRPGRLRHGPDRSGDRDRSVRINRGYSRRGRLPRPCSPGSTRPKTLLLVGWTIGSGRSFVPTGAYPSMLDAIGLSRTSAFVIDVRSGFHGFA